MSPAQPAHVGDLAAAFVDEQLDPGRRDLVLVHIAGCLPCRAEVYQQRRLKARLQALGGPGLPPALLSRLRAVAEPALPGPPVPAVAPAQLDGIRASTRPGEPHRYPQRDPHRGRRLLVGAASLMLVGVGTTYASASDGQPGSPARLTSPVLSSRTVEPAPARRTAPIRDPAFGVMTASFRR